MAARKEARLYTSIWKDQDFLALPPTAQRLYMFLISQEDLTHCGVIPLRPARWARKAAGLTAAGIEADLDLLSAGPQPFTVIDEDTGELLVRSLVRNDEVWKQPNVMKAARESAALVESGLIRAVLLSELLRIPAQDNPSAHVRKAHAEFVSDLRKGNGNPSPNRSPEGDRNSPANPDGNPPADPSQGKGEGYGPVPRVSPSPGSPSPRATAAGGTRPLWPAAVPDARPEEGDQAGGENPDTGALIAAIREVRPDWSTRSVKRALADPSVAERPWPVVCAAALAMARDPASGHPGRLKHDGPWWKTATAARAAPHKPAWCGRCDEHTRMTGMDSDDTPRRCPDCHPLREAS
jgi:hypothetical protein